jgi:outer membrane protein OmpA-like peptidoglycan-associated protein
MKKINGLLLLSAVLAFGTVTQSCKPKKVLVNKAAEVDRKEEVAEQVVNKPVQRVEEAPKAPVQEAPNYNFKNIQFELDSYVLKTDSYAALDQIYREMRKDPNAKFNIEGHASIEGSAEYNQKLSVDRANAVKRYLANSGVNPSNLTVTGFGATRPIASNDNENGRALNRRVEIKVIR